ncbi:soluble calcium-activated nucleotidase 1 [Chrysoperla carnea]|uniref:soluble calcium-activated nucleotidase 1 n=1 Tax=Chrysoperla carnea TaxID=189513 RepID=UPI001D096D53|nr:soluble calcium-activated nucleotidase 1 [Chrysoperla carnea]
MNFKGDNSSEMVLTIQDWRQALRTPHSYRVGNRTLRIQTKFMSIIILSGLLILLIIYIFPENNEIVSDYQFHKKKFYNKSYPLSAPIISPQIRTFRIGIIADLDTNSKCLKETWCSNFRKGFLSYSNIDSSVVISWDKGEDIMLKSNFASKGRGMELSELVVFNGRLLTFDDRSGIVYEIINDKAIPWIILVDGDGSTSKGFKSEWATVKDEILYVGSMGKEWTTAGGDFENHNPQYVKLVSPSGEVNHVNWVEQYKAVRGIMDITYPGYMIHESGVWSDIHSKWFFLPRRCSKNRYNETIDETMGCNVLITADANFSKIEMVKIGELQPTHGFSTFKFIPTTDDTAIVALKTEEYLGQTATYILAFTIDGKQLLPETRVSSHLKFEGIEFI